MATPRQTVYMVLMAFLCLWIKTAYSTSSDMAINNDQRDTPPKIRHQMSDNAVFPQPIAQPFQVPVQPRSDSNTVPASSGDDGAMSVRILENKDGVDMPPQIDQFVSLYFNKMVEEREKLQGSKSSQNDRVKRSAYDYGNSYGGYGGGYGGDSYPYGNYGQSYGGDNHGYGGLKDLVSGGHGYKGIHLPNKVGYSHGYTKSPLISFVKGFKPGKTYVDKGHVIRNYFRHGTYYVALQHYKLIPTVKVIPYTTYKKINVGQKVEAKYRYKAYICKYCYHGYPKIDVYEMKKPYSYAVRRFVYLPKDYNLDSYGHDNSYGNGYGNGGDSYGHGGNSYGDGSDSYGYGGDSYGHGGDSYGYGNGGYGYGGDSYGYGSGDYGNGGDSYDYGSGGYGYGGDSYGYGSGGYGNGGDSYGYGSGGYGYGGDSYGYGSGGYGSSGSGYGGSSYGYGSGGSGYGGGSYGYGNGGSGYGGDSYGYGSSGYGYGGDSYGHGGSGHSNGNSYDYRSNYGKAKVTYHSYHPKSYGGYGSGGNGYHKK